MSISGGNNSTVVDDVGIPVQMMSESEDLDNLPEISEPSLLLTERTRSTLYHALPVLVQGRNWVLLYRYNHKSMESIWQLEYESIPETKVSSGTYLVAFQSLPPHLMSFFFVSAAHGGMAFHLLRCTGEACFVLVLVCW